MALDNNKKDGLWRADKNTFLKIVEMENEHLQSALYYSENKIVQFSNELERVQANKNIFETKREELIEELKNRGVNVKSLTELGTSRFKGLKKINS